MNLFIIKKSMHKNVEEVSDNGMEIFKGAVLPMEDEELRLSNGMPDLQNVCRSEDSEET